MESGLGLEVRAALRSLSAEISTRLASLTGTSFYVRNVRDYDALFQCIKYRGSAPPHVKDNVDKIASFLFEIRDDCTGIISQKLSGSGHLDIELRLSNEGSVLIAIRAEADPPSINLTIRPPRKRADPPVYQPDRRPVEEKKALTKEQMVASLRRIADWLENLQER